jgi:nucleoside-diphosphate-sugar epimerase
MRVVVTGSAGRVGSAVHARIGVEHGVVGIDRIPGPRVDRVGDILDEDLLARCLDGAAAVVHVAALHAPHVGIEDDAEFDRINVRGTALVLRAARKAGIQRVVFTSTTAVYGHAATPPGRAGWVDEDLEPRPRTIYHRTKIEAEALLRAAAEAGDIEARIVRMSRCFPEPAPRMAVYRIHRGVDARDVAEAHALALTHRGPRHATWIVTGDTPFLAEDVEELFADARAVLRRRAPDLVTELDRRGWRPPPSIDRVYLAARAKADLGWRPRYGYREVLRLHDRGDPEVLPADSALAAGED